MYFKVVFLLPNATKVLPIFSKTKKTTISDPNVLQNFILVPTQKEITSQTTFLKTIRLSISQFD